MTKALVRRGNAATTPLSSAWLDAAELFLSCQGTRLARSRPAASKANARRGIAGPDETRVSRRLITICAWCKKIQNSQGVWRRPQTSVQAHRKAEFSHGICPACAERTYNAYRYPEMGVTATESLGQKAPSPKFAEARHAVAGAGG